MGYAEEPAFIDEYEEDQEDGEGPSTPDAGSLAWDQELEHGGWGPYDWAAEEPEWLTRLASAATRWRLHR